MPQPIKKGATVRKKGISSWKEKMGLDPKGSTDVISVSNASKEQGWILMPKAFQEATKLPGIPTGTVVSVIGHSNVGKSTLINHAIANAQKQGILPVIIDTENAFSFKYATDMGFKAEPVYGDVDVEVINPETGEVTIETRNVITHWVGDFIYVNNTILCDQFGTFNYKEGKETKTKRTVAVIEDVAKMINTILDAQNDGEIEQDILFVWDSIGSIISFQEYSSKSNSNMWAAGALSVAFNTIANDRIPSSRKLSSKYTNTLLYINKVWMDSMTSPTGPPTMRTKGGASMKYTTRLEILLGGQLTAGTKRLTASSKGVNYGYGIQTKIKVLHNVVYEDSIIACHKGFIGINELDSYKKEYITHIIKELTERSSNKDIVINEEDIEFTEGVEDEE